MSKISAYTAITSVETDDLLVVVDVNDMTMAPSGTTKKMTLSQLPSAGVIVTVPAPAGATATDTPHVTSAIASLVSALASGPATLMFQDGTYQVDSNAAVIQSVANFTVTTSGRTVIEQAPNRSGLPNNTTGNLLTIADCTDFRVEGITFDCMRDTVSPMTPLTAQANSGQASVTVASGNGGRYQVGQWLSLYGGLFSSEQSQDDNILTISSITTGGGSGGGDLITFNRNLTHTYTQLSSTSLSDGFGPYAYEGAYLTAYEVNGVSNPNTVAGRQLSYEDQQNCLHLINCQRFTVARTTGRNTWSSAVKMGDNASTALADGCSDGNIQGCIAYHGYDQGVSIWVSSLISVTGCTSIAAGWGGCVMTASSFCTITGNVFANMVYQIPISLGQGFGVAIEGGNGNVVKGNIMQGNYGNAVLLHATPGGISWGFGGNAVPTLSAFLAAQTAAGTSVQVSSTAHLTVGAPYSIIDLVRTEALTIATIVDSTHVTFTTPTQYSHASGLPLYLQIPQDNVIEGNTMLSSGTSAIAMAGSVRTNVANNKMDIYGTVATASAFSLFPVNYASTPVMASGSIVHGNEIGGGPNPTLNLYWTDHFRLTANKIAGPTSGNHAAVSIGGMTDSVIAGNIIGDVETGQGIYGGLGGSGGTTPPARLTITGNVITRCADEGIIFVAGDSLAITGNVCGSNGGNAGINLRGVTNSLIADNVCNGNANAGIQLDNQSAVYCLYNRITGNTCRDDGSGINVTTGASQTQKYGIRETGNSNYNLITGNECDSNATSQIVTLGAETYAWADIVSDAIAGTFPAVLLPTGTTSAQGALQLDGVAGDIQALGAAAAGASGLAADAKHVHPTTGMLTLLASTGAAGFPLGAASGNVITWTAPNDGALHRVMVSANMDVASGLTGGVINCNFTFPDGTAVVAQLFAANATLGTKTNALQGFLVEANTTVTVKQNTGISGGSATLWSEIWGM